MNDWQQAMPSPLFVFAFVLASLLGAGAHLILGGDARRLALFLLAAWLGFALGQAAGTSLGINWFSIGQLHILPALIGAVFALIAAFIFTSQRRAR